MIEEKNNHTRNQKRMYRIHKQEERIQDLELLVGTLQSKLDNANNKIEKIEEYIKENACYDEKTKECKCSFSSMALDNVLSIIDGE